MKLCNRSAAFVAGAWLVATIGVAPAHAVERSEATAPHSASASEGDGGVAGQTSHWGPIPERADSNTAVFDNRERPAWEYVALAPYQVVDVPVRLFSKGLGGAFIFLDDHNVIHTLSRIFGPKDLPYGATLTISASSLIGLGGGTTIYHDEFFGERNRLKIRAQYTTNASQKFTLGTLFNAGGVVRGEFGAGYRLRSKARFYGLGPNSREDDKTFYAQETSWVGASISRSLVEAVRLEATGMYSGVGARGPLDPDETAVDERFTGDARPAGFGGLSEGVTTSLALIRDTTDDTGRPERGHIQRIKASHFSQTSDGDVAFWSYRAELEQFVPLWFQERALALRAYANWIESDGADPVPFQRLLTNDEPDLLRGFKDFRWRDRGIAGLSAEYRFPIWAFSEPGGLGVDAFLLGDVGQVFNDFDEISEKNARGSFGGGFRLVTAKGFVGRFDVAWSEEDVVFRLQAEQIFQYAKGGLYNGRDKSVLR